MKCELKGLVNIKLQGEEIFKFENVLFVPKYVKNLLVVSSIVANGATMGGYKRQNYNK